MNISFLVGSCNKKLHYSFKFIHSCLYHCVNILSIWETVLQMKETRIKLIKANKLISGARWCISFITINY